MAELERAWMIRAYALGLGAGTQVVTIGFGQAVFATSTSAADAVTAVAWAINLALGLLAMTQDWFHDVQPWVDLDYQLSALLRGSFDSEQWSQLAATSGLWLLLPLVVGPWTLVRSEVK